MWKKVDNCNERYEVNELGIVRRIRTGSVLKPNKNGYVTLILLHGRSVNRSVVSIVTMAFFGKRFSTEWGFVDGNSSNCTVDNLIPPADECDEDEPEPVNGDLRVLYPSFYALVQPRRKVKERICLRCRTSFNSADMRLCSNCNHLNTRRASSSVFLD